MMTAVQTRDFAGGAWRKSSRTVSGKCVEVAMTNGVVGVRDSKDREGGVLVFPSAQWRAFVVSLRRGIG
jgi:hypothetical protein